MAFRHKDDPWLGPNGDIPCVDTTHLGSTGSGGQTDRVGPVGRLDNVGRSEGERLDSEHVLTEL